MILWRISEFASLDGEGGKLFPGRWHSGGQAVSYASDHPASCLCEMLVHVDMNFLPVTFQLLEIEIGATSVSEAEMLPADWRNNIESTRLIGDDWLNKKSTAILRVPSAIVPQASNFLLNPAHSDAAQMRIKQIFRVPLDTRLR
jgi:RES domain-containing protein